MKTKVIEASGRHVTRSDYSDTRPVLGSDNVKLPIIGSLESRTLRRLLPAGRTISHRAFDFASHSYRLSHYVFALRKKGWPIVNHDETALTRDVVKRKATYTNYELYADFTNELQERLTAFCKAVDEFEVKAKGAA